MKARRDNSENKRHFIELHRRLSSVVLILQSGTMLVISWFRKAFLHSAMGENLSTSLLNQLTVPNMSKQGKVALWATALCLKNMWDVIWHGSSQEGFLPSCDLHLSSLHLWARWCVLETLTLAVTSWSGIAPNLSISCGLTEKWYIQVN